jgi:hypothetical protein
MSLLTINGLDKLIGTIFSASGGAIMVVDDVGEILIDTKEVYSISLRYSIRKTNYPDYLYIFIYRKVFGVEGRPEVRVDILDRVCTADVDVWFKDMETFCEKVNTEIWTKY